MVHIDTDITMWSVNERNRIEEIIDNEEKTNQIKLLDEILQKVWDYEQHLAEYDMHQKMNARSMNFKKSNLSCKKLESIWNQTFANKLTQKEKADISFNMYMWHVFSYEKINSLKGINAQNAFNMANKDEVYFFYPQLELAYVISNAHNLNADDFKDIYDVYVMDIHHKWTFVCTHEGGDCVYFHEVKK